MQGLLSRLESRRAALGGLFHELDCCLQGIARPAEEAGAASAEGSGSEAASDTSSGDGGGGAEPRRRSRGGTNATVADDVLLVRSMHRGSALGSRKEPAAHPGADAGGAAYQASLARTSGGARALWATNAGEGAASKKRSHDGAGLAAATASRGAAQHAELGLHTDDLFEASSEDEAHARGGRHDGGAGSGREFVLDSDDGSSSTGSERPVDGPTMRGGTEPFTLHSNGWRAPYAAQLHASDPVNVPDWLKECALRVSLLTILNLLLNGCGSSGCPDSLVRCTQFAAHPADDTLQEHRVAAGQPYDHACCAMRGQGRSVAAAAVLPGGARSRHRGRRCRQTHI